MPQANGRPQKITRSMVSSASLIAGALHVTHSLFPAHIAALNTRYIDTCPARTTVWRVMTTCDARERGKGPVALAIIAIAAPFSSGIFAAQRGAWR